jgi:hypothetical protein
VRVFLPSDFHLELPDCFDTCVGQACSASIWSGFTEHESKSTAREFRDMLDSHLAASDVMLIVIKAIHERCTPVTEVSSF